MNLIFFLSFVLPVANLYFHNHFANYPLVFQGCSFEGELISEPPLLNLEPGQSQNFLFIDSPDKPRFISGNCTYYIPPLQEFVDFQWYKNNNNGHEFYGMTVTTSYKSEIIIINKITTDYIISDI